MVTLNVVVLWWLQQRERGREQLAGQSARWFTKNDSSAKRGSKAAGAGVACRELLINLKSSVVLSWLIKASGPK